MQSKAKGYANMEKYRKETKETHGLKHTYTWSSRKKEQKWGKIIV